MSALLLDVTRIGEASEEISLISQNVDGLYSSTDSARKGLGWEVQIKAGVDSELRSVMRRLQKQKHKMSDISRVMIEATDRAYRANQRLAREAEAINQVQFGSENRDTNAYGFLGGFISAITYPTVVGISTVQKVVAWLTGKNDDSSSQMSDSTNIISNQVSSEQQTPSNEHTGEAKIETDDQIRNRLEEEYSSLISRRRASFNGACGAFSYQQLKERGIIKGDAGIPESTSLGKDYASIWVNREKTSGGYSIETYAGTTSFQDIIDEHNGVMDTVLVSYAQDGKIFKSSAGHALVISKIQNGYVYYMESSKQWYNGQAEGTMIKLSINDFNKYYPPSSCTGYAVFTKIEG